MSLIFQMPFSQGVSLLCATAPHPQPRDTRHPGSVHHPSSCPCPQVQKLHNSNDRCPGPSPSINICEALGMPQPGLTQLALTPEAMGPQCSHPSLCPGPTCALDAHGGLCHQEAHRAHSGHFLTATMVAGQVTAILPAGPMGI